MGLFNSKPEIVASHELKYNKAELLKDLEKCRLSLYDTRDGEGQKSVLRFIEKCRNVEILNIASAREMSSEAHAYHRGRIESLTNILTMRDTAIEEIKRIRAKDKKSSTESPNVSNYLKPARTSQAQPSI